MPLDVDHVAKQVAVRKWGLPECLHVPIATLNEESITKYIGKIERVLSKRLPHKALLVRIETPPPRDERLPLWNKQNSSILFSPLQVWVDVSYGQYRAAYKEAFPDEDIQGKVLSHAMNRRVANLKGYQFVRLSPVSRSANSSSAFSEQWGKARYTETRKSPDEIRAGAFIQYADFSDILLMMDTVVGGGVMEVVNLEQALLIPTT